MASVKRFIAILFLCGVFAGWAAAENPQEAYKQGNAAYANGQFSQAAASYESARAQGLSNWVLYYNLGNAHYKAGETGRAIVNFLRAFRLQSNQTDVVDNLNLALTRIGDPLVPTEALAALFWHLFYSLSLNTLTMLSSLLFVAVCLGAALFFLGKWRPTAEPAFIAVSVLVVLGIWLGGRIALAERKDGVIVSGTAEVRAAPNMSSPANFTVPEGRRILILDEEEPIKGWLEIGVPQEGLKGWVPDASVEAV